MISCERPGYYDTPFEQRRKAAAHLWENEESLQKYLAKLKELMEPENKFPRRIRMDQWTTAEKAIYDAMQVVEKSGAHPLLTKATMLLGEAKDAVADYIDGQQLPPSKDI